MDFYNKEMKVDQSYLKKFSHLIQMLKYSLAVFISRILGLVREQMMAYYFGAGGTVDAFLVAYRIPNMLREIMAEGTMTQAFVPEFLKTLRESRSRAIELVNHLTFKFFVINLILCALMAYFAEDIVLLMAPGFKESSEEKFYLCVKMTQIMAPYLMLISLASLFAAVLNSLKMFFWPSLGPALFNVISIFSMIGFTDIMEQSGNPAVYALSFGVIFAGIGQLVLQLPFLHQKFALPKVKTFWKFLPEEKGVLHKILPGIYALSAYQINIFVTTALASQFSGAVSCLNYAFRLYAFPCGIIVVSLSQVHVVHFSEAWKSSNFLQAKKLLRKNMALLIGLLVPVVLFTWLEHENIIALVYQRGKFNSEHTLETALYLRMYILGLPAFGLYKLLTPTSYAIDHAYVPAVISTVGIILNVLLCFIIVPWVGAAWPIPLIWSLINYFNAFGLLIFLLMKGVLNLNLK